MTTIKGVQIPVDLEAYLDSESALLAYGLLMGMWHADFPVRFSDDRRFHIIGDFPWPKGQYQFWCNVYRGWLNYIQEQGVFDA